jgi:hypothetical protein
VRHRFDPTALVVQVVFLVLPVTLLLGMVRDRVVVLANVLGSARRLLP